MNNRNVIIGAVVVLTFVVVLAFVLVPRVLRSSSETLINGNPSNAYQTCTGVPGGAWVCHVLRNNWPTGHACEFGGNCTGMPPGSACWSDAMCASGQCSGNAGGLRRGTCS